MATTPIYGENSLNIFSGTKRPLALGLSMGSGVLFVEINSSADPDEMPYDMVYAQGQLFAKIKIYSSSNKKKNTT